MITLAQACQQKKRTAQDIRSRLVVCGRFRGDVSPTPRVQACSNPLKAYNLLLFSKLQIGKLVLSKNKAPQNYLSTISPQKYF